MKKAFAILFAVVLLFLTSCASIFTGSSVQSPFGQHDGTSVSDKADASADASRNAVNPSEDTGSAGSSGRTPLSPAELSFFTEYFKQEDNNGFLLSSYSKPAGIDLHELFYYGAGIASEDDAISQEEKDAFIKAVNIESIDGAFFKLTSQQIDDFLQEKMGVSFSDVNKGMNWIYLEKYDAYYVMLFDTNYCFFDCTGGYKTSDGTYVIQCRNASEYGQQIDSCEVTLHKSGDHYLFVSNKAHKAY